MSRYRINIDNDLPSKANIDAYKDFDTLHRQYQVQSRYNFWRRLYNNPRYFAVLVALVSVSALVYQSSREVSPEPSAFIAPPIPPKNIPSVSQKLPLDIAQILTYENGTRVHVPAHAFVDEQNNPVQDKVELRYREFRDAADIFIAGIPMEYDSAGETHNLESAAMLEILAYANNKPVFLQKGKTLEVEYYSPITGKDFSVYHLDTIKRNWQFEGKDLLRNTTEERPVAPRPELEYILDTEADTFLTRNVAIPSQRPGKVFQIEVLNADNYSMLAGKKQLVWEYIEMAGFTDPWKEGLMPNEQAKALATPYRAAGVFTLELPGGAKFVARPLLKASSFEEAQEAYQQKLDIYKKSLAAYEANKTLAQQKLQAREAALKDYQERLRAWEKSSLQFDSLNRQGVYRKFIIRKLGINQLARILNFPLMKIPLSISSDTDEDFGEKLYQQGRKISLIHPDLNTVFACQPHPTESGKFLVRFDPQQENLICASDKEENLYLLGFRKIPEDLSVTVTKAQQPFKDHTSLKTLLIGWIGSIEQRTQ